MRPADEVHIITHVSSKLEDISMTGDILGQSELVDHLACHDHQLRYILGLDSHKRDILGKALPRWGARHMSV